MPGPVGPLASSKRTSSYRGRAEEGSDDTDRDARPVTRIFELASQENSHGSFALDDTRGLSTLALHSFRKYIRRSRPGGELGPDVLPTDNDIGRPRKSHSNISRKFEEFLGAVREALPRTLGLGRDGGAAGNWQPNTALKLENNVCSWAIDMSSLKLKVELFWEKMFLKSICGRFFEILGQ